MCVCVRVCVCVAMVNSYRPWQIQAQRWQNVQVEWWTSPTWNGHWWIEHCHRYSRQQLNDHLGGTKSCCIPVLQVLQNVNMTETAEELTRYGTWNCSTCSPEDFHIRTEPSSLRYCCVSFEKCVNPRTFLPRCCNVFTIIRGEYNRGDVRGMATHQAWSSAFTDWTLEDAASSVANNTL